MLSFEEYKARYHLSLSAEQEIACRTVDGPILLLAVPGSGKTTVMIARLGYLIHGLGVPPASILAVTYSVAGAREMQARYQKLFGENDVEIRTIHGFCAALIRRYEQLRHTTAFRLMDSESEVTWVLREILTEAGCHPTENELRDVKTAVSFCRNGLLTDEEIARTVKIEGVDFPEIYRRYRLFKRENALMDYDDQLAYGYRILQTCPEVNAAYTDRFRYFCVDEAQDTSRLQHEILRVASRKTGNLFMVGDEDQSIYGFRAAYPEGLLTFRQRYPGAGILSIGQNYRSSGVIVEAAGAFISHSGERLSDKRMVTGNPPGEPILHTVLSDRRRLPEHIRRLAEAVRDGKEPSAAVLCRLNDSLLPFIDLLSEKGIPFRVRGGDGLFFTHFLVTDVKAILRFAADPFDGELFRQLYYKFYCGLGRADCERALRDNVGPRRLSFPEYIASSPDFPDTVRKRTRRLAALLARINEADVYEAVDLILSSGYGRYLERRTRDNGKTAALRFLADRHRSRDGFLRRLETLEEAVKRGSVSQEGLLLSTIHSAKGMEFDRVVLCDALDGILPAVAPGPAVKLTKEEKSRYEEERRLFYVAVTRARRLLEVVSWEREFGEPAGDFSFIRELLGLPEPKAGTKTGLKREPMTGRSSRAPRELSEAESAAFYVGATVVHKVFGEGVVIGRRGRVIQVKFSRLPLPKRLDLSFCVGAGLLTAL